MKTMTAVTQLVIGIIHKGNKVSRLCLLGIFKSLFYFFSILFVNFLSIWYHKCFLPVIFLQGMWVYDIVITRNIFFRGRNYFIYYSVISCASFYGCVVSFTSILSFWSSVITPEQTICERKVKVGSRSSKKQFKQFFKVAFSLGSISCSSIEADYFKFLLNKLYGQKSLNLLEYILNILIFRYCNTVCR